MYTCTGAASSNGCTTVLQAGADALASSPSNTNILSLCVLCKLQDAFGIEFPPVSTQLRLCNLLCKPLGSFLGPTLAVSHRCRAESMKNCNF